MNVAGISFSAGLDDPSRPAANALGSVGTSRGGRASSGSGRGRAALAERQERTELQKRYASLTPRERDVLAGIVAGLLNKQIAGELGTTEATVKEQRGHVMTRMQAGSVAELVRFASRLGITPAGGGRIPGAEG
jgi:DNA-binding NarL/FixJ family response regulator